MERHHTIIGLPASGKTTFLAALWHLLNGGETKTLLTLDKIEGDVSYLNEIAKSWRACKPVPRTSRQLEKERLALHVCEVATGDRMVLSFPDLSGETFENQVEHRACRAMFVEDVNGDGGLVLFVTANSRPDGITHGDMHGMMADAGERAVPVAWSIKAVPQQVQMVELLQFMQRAPFARRCRRLAVIVSAWDVVADQHPGNWLQREMPLLWQFLESNPESFDCRIWGVSAQGGELSEKSAATLKGKVPSERIRCVGEGCDGHDITAPLVWLNRSN